MYTNTVFVDSYSIPSINQGALISRGPDKRSSSVHVVISGRVLTNTRACMSPHYQPWTGLHSHTMWHSVRMIVGYIPCTYCLNEYVYTCVYISLVPRPSARANFTRDQRSRINIARGGEPGDEAMVISLYMRAVQQFRWQL